MYDLRNGRGGSVGNFCLVRWRKIVNFSVCLVEGKVSISIGFMVVLMRF